MSHISAYFLRLVQGSLPQWVCSFICNISYLRQWGSTRYGSISWHIWCHTSPLTFWGFVPISFSLPHWCICNHIGAWTVLWFYFSVLVNKRRLQVIGISWVRASSFLLFPTDIRRLRNASGASPWAFAIKLAKAPLNAPYNKSDSSCPCGSHQLAVLDDDALHHGCMESKGSISIVYHSLLSPAVRKQRL